MFTRTRRDIRRLSDGLALAAGGAGAPTTVLAPGSSKAQEFATVPRRAAHVLQALEAADVDQ
jgi:hypothetical protein